jgi:hydroxymethylpyrimidine/phosphomethylpyrimidine kinase
MTKIALTIAGSDSGGGAGIQADVKTFAFHGVHGATALTCVTAQNTLGVFRVDSLSEAAVIAQIEAVVSDLGVNGTKTGMLLNQGIIEAVTEMVIKYNLAPLVVDPVMVSRAGSQLIADEAIASLKSHLLPLANIVTPNRYEAQILSGLEINNLEDLKKAVRIIAELGAKTVLIKGGGMTGELWGVDIFFDGQSDLVLKTETINTKNSHGTGCTLSAAITANLALGKDLLTSVTEAKIYVTNALKYALNIGQGTGPLGHFFPLLHKY